jgi:dGTPase
VSDIIAYINHDLDDAIRAGVIRSTDIPKNVNRVLGDTHAKRIDAMVRDFIYKSLATDLESLAMSEKVLAMTYKLRDFLYERVYESEMIIREFKKAKRILRDIYSYYLEHSEEVSIDVVKGEKSDKHQTVCDFIAGMTDRFAMMTYEKIFLPQQWTVL